MYEFLLYEIQLYTEWLQDEKNDIPTLPSGDTIFINICVISFLNQSAFSIFARFLMVRARGALSLLLFLTQAKNFKKLRKIKSLSPHSHVISSISLQGESILKLRDRVRAKVDMQDKDFEKVSFLFLVVWMYFSWLVCLKGWLVFPNFYHFL